MPAKRTNKEIMEEVMSEIFQKHDLSRIDNLMRDDYIQHNPNVPQGKAGFVGYFKGKWKAVPDSGCVIRRIVTEGDIAMVYSVSTGTHTGGEWLGVPATGNKLSFDVVDIFRFQDGKLAEHWDVADTLTLFTQLGVVQQR
jgi:predicted SnoaL-like aldol condensation-catalyzing enzyme